MAEPMIRVPVRLLDALERFNTCTCDGAGPMCPRCKSLRHARAELAAYELADDVSDNLLVVPKSLGRAFFRSRWMRWRLWSDLTGRSSCHESAPEPRSVATERDQNRHYPPLRNETS